MTQVLIDWDGRQWAVDTEEITLAQAFVIKDTTKDPDMWAAGRPLSAWLTGVSTGDPACVRALYWLMLQQDGQQVAIAGLEFPVLKFYAAWTEASTLASGSAEQLRKIIAEAEKALGGLRDALAAAEKREAAEADDEPDRPTRRRATASPPSPAPA